MKRFAFLILFVVCFLFILSWQPVHAQRFAQCDVCGYCQGMAKPPGSWADCQKCMYEDIPGNPAASDNKTLAVIDDANSPYYNAQITPKPGRYYTQIGCIRTDLGFSSQGASGSVVAYILKIIFQISGGIAFIYLIYGAYVVITARGEPTALNRGRSIIFGAIIGLIFTMLITLIINLIGSGVLRIPGFGGAASTGGGSPGTPGSPSATSTPQSAAQVPFTPANTQQVVDECVSGGSSASLCQAIDQNHDGTVSVSEMEAWARSHQ